MNIIKTHFDKKNLLLTFGGLSLEWHNNHNILLYNHKDKNPGSKAYFILHLFSCFRVFTSFFTLLFLVVKKSGFCVYMFSHHFATKATKVSSLKWCENMKKPQKKRFVVCRPKTSSYINLETGQKHALFCFHLVHGCQMFSNSFFNKHQEITLK